MSLPRLSLRYSNIVIAILLVALGIGCIQYVTMPRRADPAFTLRTCQVVTQWPGAQAVRVEQQVTKPLEDAIDSLEEVDYISSTSKTGQSVLMVNLEDSLPVEEIPQVWDRVRAKVEQVSPKLPPGSVAPVVNDDFGDTAVMLIALYERPDNDGRNAASRGKRRYSPRELELVAERLQQQIALLDGVASADIHGEQQESIYLEVGSGRWANLDVTIDQLEQLLQARNISAAGGSIDTDRSRIGIQPTGEFDAVDQIRSVIVDRDDDTGAPIRLSDLGIQIRRSYADPPTVSTRYGGPDQKSTCVVVSFTMKDGTNVVELGERVRKLLVDMQEKDKTIPPDIAVDVVFDEASFVDDKIGDFVINVIQAIVIVLLVAFFMAGMRSALIMAVAIPFVMIISIGIAATTGIELEQMSIASLIIALGMLVDNAVVVCDNVARHRNQGLDATEGTARGVEQIMFPILMGTLTTVCAFLPLAFFLPGNKGEYIFSIPAVVSITLLCSWVLALTLSTLNAFWFIKPSEEASRTPMFWCAGKIGHLIRRGRSVETRSNVADRYATLVGGCLRAKPIVLGIALALLVGAVLLPVGTEFFPSDKRDLLYIDVWLPEGSSYDATDRETHKVEALMERLSQVEGEDGKVDRLKQYVSSIGGSGPRFALGVNPQPPASNFAQIIAQTTSSAFTDQYVIDLKEALDRELPGVRVIPRKLALGPPVDAPLGVRVYSSGYSQPGFGDMTELRKQAERVKGVFSEIDGVIEVRDEWGELGHELKVDVDEERANTAGVTNAAIAKTLNAYYSGHQLTTLREGDHRVPVILRLPVDERDQVIDDRTIFVEGASGKVPLDSVAHVALERATLKIERRDRNRMIEVRAGVAPGFLANDKYAEAQPGIREIESSLPSGYYFETAGTMEKSIESQVEMSTAFGAGLVLIVLCLVIQYNSFVKPLVILMTVPMGAVGALFGLWVTGNPLGFMPMLGLVSLTGIVVNSGILYIEFADNLIRQRLASGQDLPLPGEKSCNGLKPESFRQCLTEAGRQRLLPIFLTVSTTVAGLLPLAFFGGPLWEAMAWLLIFGLLIATALTLLVLPVIYGCFVEWFGLRLVRYKPPSGAVEDLA